MHERAIQLWAYFAHDFSPSTVDALKSALDCVRADKAKIALVIPFDVEATSAESSLSDLVISNAPPPAPFGLFAALERAGLDDVRELGVLGAHPATIMAAHRAGVGAIVGIEQPGIERADLLQSQPDVIISPGQFATLDSLRYGRHRLLREQVLLNPGPAIVSDRVHRAMAGPDLCHREREYYSLVNGVREKLLKTAGVDDQWEVALLAGSGTAALEAMTIGSVRVGRKLLVCRNGVYGLRIETIARSHGIDVYPLEAPETEPIDPETVRTALASDSTIDAVAVVHHETTTGLLNPVHEIAIIAQEFETPVMCDAISSLGAERLALQGSGIDLVACSANKCLHGLPGLAFVLLSPFAQQRLRTVPRRSLYLDLLAYLEAHAKSSVPFTPAIPAVYGLDAALDELLEEGLVNRQATYARRMAFLDQELRQIGLVPRVAPAHRSHSVRSLPLPPGIPYDPLHDALKGRGYVIYAGLGDAATTSFRICALGNISIDVLAGFMTCLRQTLLQMGATLPDEASFP